MTFSDRKCQETSSVITSEAPGRREAWGVRLDKGWVKSVQRHTSRPTHKRVHELWFVPWAKWTPKAREPIRSWLRGSPVTWFLFFQRHKVMWCYCTFHRMVRLSLSERYMLYISHSTHSSKVQSAAKNEGAQWANVMLVVRYVPFHATIISSLTPSDVFAPLNRLPQCETKVQRTESKPPLAFVKRSRESDWGRRV